MLQVSRYSSFDCYTVVVTLHNIFLGITIRFMESDYRTIEGEPIDIDIRIYSDDNRELVIANPITVQVRTLTADESQLHGNPRVIPPPLSTLSPNLAGK